VPIERLADGLIHVLGRHRNAAATSLLDCAHAIVVGKLVAAPTIADIHHSAATTAAHQTAQQCRSAFHRATPVVGLGRRVLAQLRLVAFKLFPANVTGVMIMNDNLPLLGIAHQPAMMARLMAGAFALPAMASIDKSAGVSRIVQER